VKTKASEDELPLSPWFVGAFANRRRSPAATIQKDYLRAIGERMGLKSLGRSLRHACRSLLDSLGTPTGIQQKRIRHAQVSTTMNTCGRAFWRTNAKPIMK
jgi:integrase